MPGTVCAINRRQALCLRPAIIDIHPTIHPEMRPCLMIAALIICARQHLQHINCKVVKYRWLTGLGFRHAYSDRNAAREELSESPI